MSDQDAVHQWIPVIGRSLAYLCVQAGELKDKPLADRAMFLEGLGIERKEVASMLGTSVASVTETLSRVKRTKKGAKNNGPKSNGRKAR